MDTEKKPQTSLLQTTDIYSIDVDDHCISRKKRLTIKNPDELTESPTSFHEAQVTREDTKSFKQSSVKEKDEYVHEKKKRTIKSTLSETSPSKSSSKTNVKQSQNVRRTKRYRTTMQEEEFRDAVRDILAQMRKAAEDDSIARSEERPAVSKLKLLPQVLADIVKPKWVHLFLKEGVCDELARWLTILPGGLLPTMSIRSSILQTLQKIPISLAYIDNTNLGKRLVQLWKSPDELEENRLLIKNIIETLLRPVLSFNTLRYQENSVSKSFKKPQQPIVSDTVDLQEKKRKSEDLPKISNHSFTDSRLHSFKIAPKPAFTGLQHSDLSAHRDNQSTMARLNRMIHHKTHTSHKIGKRASACSSGKNRTPF